MVFKTAWSFSTAMSQQLVLVVLVFISFLCEGDIFSSSYSVAHIYMWTVLGINFSFHGCYATLAKVLKSEVITAAVRVLEVGSSSLVYYVSDSFERRGFHSCCVVLVKVLKGEVFTVTVLLLKVFQECSQLLCCYWRSLTGLRERSRLLYV